MPNYFEYTTLSDLRTSGEGKQLNIAASAGDEFFLELIREVSKDMNSVFPKPRTFWPRKATKAYTPPVSGDQDYDRYNVSALRPSTRPPRDFLLLDDDLLEASTLLNGDGTTIASTKYILEPANDYPKWKLKLRRTSGITWQPNSDGDYEQVVSLTGIYGYHDDYSAAWVDTGLTIQGGGINSSATSVTFSATSGLKAGMLLKWESEYVYLSTVGTPSTIVRQVNGTSPAAHAAGVAVSYWQTMFNIQRVCRQAVAAHHNLRNNPMGQQVIINGVQFNTPNSVLKWIEEELACYGIDREGIG